MAHKLLVITAGTVAAGVGKAFVKQVEAHSASELQPVARYIDTASLLTRYSELHNGDWFQMTINPQYIDTVLRSPQNYPDLDEVLFPDRRPEISGSGGGSIRYNAASALVVNRRRLKEWLTNSITELVKADTGQVQLSVSLIVSAVGATGSGSLERLVDLVVDCAQAASIPMPLHCDVFILQPGMQEVTDLGLSNTLALYAEMAASRLDQDKSKTKSYRGRTIMVGWGSEHAMGSMDQLKEAAATLVRITHDPSTDIAAEFQEREVDNHVLSDFDWQTTLPSHLSSATAVTVSLGDLEERIIKRDTVRLIDTLVFGAMLSRNAGGEYIVPDLSTNNHQGGPLMSKLADFLQGETPEERYRHLIERLKERLPLRSLNMHAAQLQGSTGEQQAASIRNVWRYDKSEISKGIRNSIQTEGARLAGTALNGIHAARRIAITNGRSLQGLCNEYQEMEKILSETLAYQPEARGYALDDREINNRLHALERANNRRRDATLRTALQAVQENVESLLQRELHASALEMLHLLRDNCAESRRNLEIVLEKVRRQRKNNPEWSDGEQKFHIDMHHQLHLSALSNDQEIDSYASLVSVFASTRKRNTSAAGVIGQRVTGEQQGDQINDFQLWLGEEDDRLNALFRGDIEALLNLAESYARKQVHVEVESHSVIDVLLQTGEEMLVKRLREASARAYSLVPFNEQFANERRETRLISAHWHDEEQRALLQKALNKTFGQGQCTLVGSRDPSEIIVFYYVDGLPMSAINDLTGRCLDAFLKRARAWYRQPSSSGHNPSQQAHNKQQKGVPVYSGNDAQKRVLETDVIYHLYEVRGQNVDEYDPAEIPELDHGTNPKP